MQQSDLFPFGSVLGNPFLLNGGVGDLSDGVFESSRVFFLVPFLLFQGGGMDLSKVWEKVLSSVRSAQSLGLLPSAVSSDQPEGFLLGPFLVISRWWNGFVQDWGKTLQIRAFRAITWSFAFRCLF